MPSVTKENYLKALYTLHQISTDISVSDLGQLLEVSKPTVSDMVKKLEVKGWVAYEKYKPLQLTDLGEKVAALVIRKHRLSEMFLVQVMGFGWEEVHDVAEELEHIRSEKLFDRMDELMGFPSEDPHGSPIPDKEGNLISPAHVVLSSVAAGSKVVFRALKDSSVDFLLYLNKKDLQLGAEINVESVESFDKSVVVTYANHSSQVLTDRVASRLLVELI
jgi:DtxR family Mn-dependent transcriptional regulator